MRDRDTLIGLVIVVFAFAIAFGIHALKAWLFWRMK